MKPNVLKRCTAVFLSVLLVFAVSACSADPAEDGSDVDTVNVTLSILYPQDEAGSENAKDNDAEKDEGKKAEKDEDAVRTNVENYPMQVQEDATVMQILEAYSDQEGIELEVDTSGTPYVTSINKVAADGSSGWVCEVNGDSNIAKEAAEYKVKDGDAIVWSYIAR